MLFEMYIVFLNEYSLLGAIVFMGVTHKNFIPYLLILYRPNRPNIQSG